MAREEYRFDINANTDQVVRQLRNIDNLVNRLASRADKVFSGVNSRGVNNNFTVTQKSMDKAYRSMQDMTRQASLLRQALSDASKEFSNRGNLLGSQIASGRIGDIDKLTRKVQSAYRQISQFRQTSSSAFKINIDDSGLDDYMNRLDRIQRKRMSLQNTLHSSRSMANTALRYANQLSDTGHLTYSQGTRLNSALTGGYAQQQRMAQDLQRQVNAARDTYVNAQSRRMQAQRSGTADPTEITRLRQSEDEAQKILQLLHQAANQMQNITNKFEQARQTVAGNAGSPNTVTPNKDSFRGMLSSRAPAIGLNAMLAAGATVTGRYMRGSSIMDQIRPDVVYGRTQTNGFGGQSDSSYIQNMVNQGRRQGFGATESNSFYTTMLGMAGYGGMGNLRSGAGAMMNFSRSTGLSAEDTTGFFGAVGAQGGVRNASQIRYIQQGIVGAVKQSGMEGREKEQVQALESIVSNGSSGRNMSTNDIRQYMATQSIFAQTGSRALQGNSGAQAINSMNNTIQSGWQNPFMSYMFGMGSKYTGISGYWKMQQQMQKGATPENIQQVMSSANRFSGGNSDYTKIIMRQMFPDLTTDQIDALSTAQQKGNFSSSSVSKILKSNQRSGRSQSKANAAGYNGSEMAGQNANKAAKDAQSIAEYNSTIAKTLRGVNTQLSGLPWELYAFGAAIVAVTTQLAGTMIALGGSRGIKKMTSGSYGDFFGGGGGSGKGGSGGSSGGGIFTRARQSTKRGTGRIRDYFNRATGGVYAGNPLAGQGGNAESPIQSGQKTGGGFFSRMLRGGGMLKGFGIAGAGIGIASGISSLFTAPKGQKMQTAGSVAGNLGGGLGGAALGFKGGAALGSIFGPVGTGVGGVAGSILGGIGGSGAGQWLGGKVGSGLGWLGGKIGGGFSRLFGQGNSREEADSNNQKSRNEKQRQRNTKDEKTNYGIFRNALNYAHRLIGEFGSVLKGSGIGSDSSTSSSGGKSKVSGFSKKVNSAISTAMQRAGVSGKDWTSGLSYIIQHESSGNPNATNKSGAKGLMQLKSDNVQGNWKDPTDNVYSGIEYIKKRYKTIDNAVAHWKKYHWYAGGTGSSAGSNVGVGDGGEPEIVIANGKAAVTPSTPTVYQNFPQGSQVIPSSKLGGFSGSNVQANINVNVSVDGQGNVTNPNVLKKAGNQIGSLISPMQYFSKTYQRS